MSILVALQGGADGTATASGVEGAGEVGLAVGNPSVTAGGVEGTGEAGTASANPSVGFAGVEVSGEAGDAVGAVDASAAAIEVTNELGAAEGSNIEPPIPPTGSGSRGGQPYSSPGPPPTIWRHTNRGRNGRAALSGVEGYGEVGEAEGRGDGAAIPAGLEGRVQVGQVWTEGIQNPTEDQLMDVLLLV